MSYDYHDDYSTPDREFLPLMAEFRFVCDLAASAFNPRLRLWLGPGGLAPDALVIPWHQLKPGEWLWLNPPFRTDLLLRFMAKAADEAALGARIVCILPAHRTEQPWWQRYVCGVAHEVRSVKGRTKYELRGRALEAWRAEEAERAAKQRRKPKKKPDAPNFPSCIAVFDGPNPDGITRLKAWDPAEFAA
jgi:hypothetical protein